MVNSDEEEVLISPSFVKVELEQFGDGDEEIRDPLSPSYNPIPTEEAHRELHNSETETKQQRRTGKAKQPPNNKNSKEAKTPKKNKDSSRKSPRQKKPEEKLVKKREPWREDQRASEKVKEEVASTDEEETSQIPKSKWRKKRVSEMTPEKLEAKGERGKSRQKRERKQCLSRGKVAKNIEKLGLEEMIIWSDDNDAQKREVKSKSSNSVRHPRPNVPKSKVEGTSLSEKIIVNVVYRRKHVDEMTPDEDTALKVKRREEAHRKREKSSRQSQGVEPSSEGERSSKPENRDSDEYRAKRAAAMKLKRARMTEEEHTALKVKRRKRVDEMTPEELTALKVKQREAARLRRARMTDEELEERRRTDRERRREKRRLAGKKAPTEKDREYKRRYLQRKRETMTAEQKTEQRQKSTMRNIMKLASMTEEELAEHKQRKYMKNVARFSRMTREEREEFRRKKNEKQREIRVAQRTPEKIEKTKEKNREMYRNMTSEQREKLTATKKRYRKKRLENLKQDPERMNNIRAKVNVTNERKGGGPESGDGQKRTGGPRLPIEVVKERRRLADRKRALKRKLIVQDLLDSGMPMEEIMQKLQTPEQRSRRRMWNRVGAARRKLTKQLSKMGAPPEQITAKVSELEKSYDHSPYKRRVYKSRPSRFQRMDRSELLELLEMNPDPVNPVQPEPTPPPSPVNNDVDYDDDADYDDGGGRHDDDYSASPPPPETEEAKVSHQHQPTASSYPYHTNSPKNWEGASTSSTCATPPASTYQDQPPPALSWRNQPPPQPTPPPPPKECQDNSVTHQESGSSSDSEDGGGAKRGNRRRRTTPRRTGAGRKDYGPRGGFRVTLETKKLAVCDECGHTYAETYMLEHKNNFHNKNFVDGKCVLCGESFPTGKLFYKHFLNYHEKITKRQRSCRGSRLRNNDKSMTEEEVEKWRLTLVECDLCGESYTSARISSHKKLRHNPHFVDGKCTICNASFLTSRSYASHFRKEHTIEYNEAFTKSKSKFICEVCGKGFTEKQFLANHFHYNHGDGAKEANFLKCSFCEKKFKYKHVMEHHVQKDHPSEGTKVIPHHECRACHQKFRYQTELGEHISTQHPESYFPCPHCNSFRTSKQNLYFHFLVCKKTPKGFVKEFGDKNVVSLEKTPLKCEVCEKDVTVKSLKRHYKEVHGVEEDLYPCGECPRMFKVRQYWVNHMDEVHGIEFDDELKEKVRKMQVLDKTMLEIKEGGRCGGKKSERFKKGKGKPRSRRKNGSSQKFVNVSSEEEEEEELSDKEDSSEANENVESEALKRMRRKGTKSRPRIKIELPNVEEEKRLVISVVRMSEEEIREAVRKNGGPTILRTFSIASRR